jgi:fructan beta-fructosidase
VLGLKAYPDGVRLTQTPIREVESLRSEVLLRGKGFSAKEANDKIQAAHVTGDTLEIEAEIAVAPNDVSGFRLRKSRNEETLVGVSAKTHEVFVDRTHSGLTSFSRDFPGRHSVVLRWTAPTKLHIFLDRSSVEVFANDGETVLTDRIYPSFGSEGVETYSGTTDSRISSLIIWKLHSIWK